MPRHLKVLESAGLITRKRVGKEHRIQIDPAPIVEARDWISLYAEAWQDQFDKLDGFLERGQLTDKIKTSAGGKRREQQS